jgi:hypothetical protein
MFENLFDFMCFWSTPDGERLMAPTWMVLFFFVMIWINVILWGIVGIDAAIRWLV